MATSASWLLWSHLHLPSNCCWCLTLEVARSLTRMWTSSEASPHAPKTHRRSGGKDISLASTGPTTPSGTPPYSLSIFLACWRYSLGRVTARRSTALMVARGSLWYRVGQHDITLSSASTNSSTCGPSPPPTAGTRTRKSGTRPCLFFRRKGVLNVK